MFLDFDIAPRQQYAADVCIIGAGAAGFACAVSLLGEGIKVLLLESGGKGDDARTAQLNVADVVGGNHEGTHTARPRRIGGATTKWGGQVYPFLEEDFSGLPEVNRKSWPIGYADIADYYPQAERILGTDTTTGYEKWPWEKEGFADLPLSTAAAELFVTKWTPQPNLHQLHIDKIAESVDVHLLSNATAVECIPTTDRTAVDAVKVKSVRGHTALIRARYYVAAGGAFETIRLFLSSKRFGEEGMGNRQDLVGRYIQDHVSAVVGRIVPTSRAQFHKIFDPFYKNGFKYLPRIRMRPSACQRAGILHASGQIMFDQPGDDPLSIIKGLYGNYRRDGEIKWADILPVMNVQSLKEFAIGAYRYNVQGRGPVNREGPIWLEILSEQEPVWDSRVTLGETRDVMGMQGIKLNWEISDLTLRTIQKSARLIGGSIESEGIGRVYYENWLSEMDGRTWLKDAYHQAGGLIMGADEKSGVVDAKSRVFGLDNMYVASSAVFPSSSFSNITLTIVALAIRTAERLVDRCKAQVPHTQQWDAR